MATEEINFEHSETYRNENKVPQKVWRKWSKSARWVFNDLYTSLLGSKMWLSNSLQKKITPQEHKVASWNAAWLAAEAVEGERGVTV